MRAFLVAGAALALGACGGGGETEANNTADPLTVDGNMMVDDNLSLEPMPGMDGNGAMDANTQNMMMQDAMTNDADTNLANGM